VSLAAAQRAELRPGGRLVASGIFRDREAEVGAAFTGVGLTVVNRWANEDWVALEAVVPG
jgi:ribosomal protein L11 methylase PrmA